MNTPGKAQLIEIPLRVLEPPSTNPHFAAIGGEAALARLAERFYYYMDTLPCAARIRAMHPAQLGPVTALFTRYLVEWTGGPRDYSHERGHPRLGQRHQAFAIGQAERDAWLTCMRHALSDVVPDPALRAELEAAFTRVADAVRNDVPHAAHAQHAAAQQPLLAIPRSTPQ